MKFFMEYYDNWLQQKFMQVTDFWRYGEGAIKQSVITVSFRENEVIDKEKERLTIKNIIKAVKAVGGKVIKIKRIS